MKTIGVCSDVVCVNTNMSYWPQYLIHILSVFNTTSANLDKEVQNPVKPIYNGGKVRGPKGSRSYSTIRLKTNNLTHIMSPSELYNYLVHDYVGDKYLYRT